MIFPWRVSNKRRMMVLTNFLFLLSLTIIVNTENTQTYPYKVIEVENGKIAPANVFSQDTGKKYYAKVIKVIDGDTIILESGEKVRYIGIDSPEKDSSENFYYEEAKRINEELVLGKIVRLEKDVSETDRYDRLLRYVFINSVFINEEIVEKGFAQVATYPPDVAYKDIFLQAETYARENRLGIWEECR